MPRDILCSNQGDLNAPQNNRYGGEMMFLIDYFWRHWVTKKCEHPKKYRTIRAETNERIYYICPICLTGWHVNKVDG